MSEPVRLITGPDRAFARFSEARARAFETGRREDFDYAGRCFAAGMDEFLRPERRWPRDPESLRMLTPSEVVARRSRP